MLAVLVAFSESESQDRLAFIKPVAEPIVDVRVAIVLVVNVEAGRAALIKGIVAIEGVADRIPDVKGIDALAGPGCANHGSAGQGKVFFQVVTMADGVGRVEIFLGGRGIGWKVVGHEIGLDQRLFVNTLRTFVAAGDEEQGEGHRQENGSFHRKILPKSPLFWTICIIIPSQSREIEG